MLWTAWLAANICMWMCDVAAAWLMTTISGEPVLVALVQTASTLPMFLLALPCGALADMVDRRRWFLATQYLMVATGIFLAIAAYLGMLTAPVLLALVFTNGVGMAMRFPVFLAIVPEVVPSGEMPQAIALHTMAINASRVIAPLVAGLLLAAFGSTSVFLAVAALSLGGSALILRWKYSPAIRTLPAERLMGAMRVGAQFVGQSRPLRVVIARICLVNVQLVAPLAMLPLFATELDGGARTYTVLLACIGVGAITVGAWLPRLRERLAARTLINLGSCVHAISITLAALAPNVWVAAAAMLVTGGAWITATNSLHVSAQLCLPGWVRARAMSVFFMAAMGGSAIGAVLWGTVASVAGVRASLGLGAALGLAVVVAVRRWRVAGPSADELAPVPFTSAPTAEPIDPGAGPVFVSIEYVIDPEDTAAFQAVMAESRRARLRGGALSWSLLRDAEDPRRHVEHFVDPSWLEHLRRLDRLTAADARLRERRAALHRGVGPPLVKRLISEDVPRETSAA